MSSCRALSRRVAVDGVAASSGSSQGWSGTCGAQQLLASVAPVALGPAWPGVERRSPQPGLRTDRLHPAASPSELLGGPDTASTGRLGCLPKPAASPSISKIKLFQSMLFTLIVNIKSAEEFRVFGYRLIPSSVALLLLGNLPAVLAQEDCPVDPASKAGELNCRPCPSFPQPCPPPGPSPLEIRQPTAPRDPRSRPPLHAPNPTLRPSPSPQP